MRSHEYQPTEKEIYIKVLHGEEYVQITVYKENGETIIDVAEWTLESKKIREFKIA